VAEAFPLHAVSLEWFLDAEALLRHVLVVGGSGSGKTNTALDIVELALTLGFNVVVFDVKGEYRCLVGSDAFPGGLWLLGVGLPEGRLLVNPLEPPSGVASGLWMHLFADVLTRCYGLSDPSRRILFDCVGHLYRQYQVGTGGREFPALRELEQAVRRFRAGSPAEANSRRALESRLRILGSGELGRSVVCDFDAPFWEERQFVALVELKGVVAVRDQQFLAELLVAKLLEARKQNPRLRERPVLVVLEEAHRVLSEARPVSQRGTRSLLELAVAEGRSWRVGFLVVDQSPSLVSHYVVENTGTKLVHLLGAGEDVEVMRRVMGLSESERRLFAELQVGEAMLLALRPFTLSGERITSRLWRIRLPCFAEHAASNAVFADYLSHQATEVVDLRRRRVG
jgi:DNA helicase HerA-like ATPase